MSKFLTALNTKVIDGLDCDCIKPLAAFSTPLDARADDSDKIWMLLSPLVYESDSVGRIEVPEGFCTDLSSVPRVPIIYMLWGGRLHYEGVLHDFLYRIDCPVQVSYGQANWVFYEAATARGKPGYIKRPMYIGVCAGGWPHWKRRTVSWPKI